MKKLLIATVSALALLTTVQASAQGAMGGGGGGDRARPVFAEIDSDTNEILSAEELETAGFTGMLARMDADENGEISLEEFNNRPQGAGGGGGQRGGQ